MEGISYGSKQIEMLSSFSGERVISLGETVASSLKSFRTDRTEAIFISAPKYLINGGTIFVNT